MSKNPLKYLTEAQVQFFHDNGYLLVENFSSPAEVVKMRQEAELIMERLEKEQNLPVHVFSTGSNQAAERTNYFRDSVDGVVPFFETKAIDMTSKTFKTSFKKAINKIGHALHVQDPVFKEITHAQKCRDICEDLGVTHPIVPQSMYILKEAEYGAEVSPHQDSTFLWSDAPSCTGFWIALDDATLENGCLWAIPGSHKGEVRTRFVLSEDGQDLSFQPNIGNTWDVWPKSSFTPLPVVSGTLVLIHGALVHMSLENASKNARHIYSWHVVSADQKFSDRNWMGTGPFAPL